MKRDNLASVLPLREVHLWRARLGAFTDRIEAVQRVLWADELERASAFRNATDRNAFVLRRGFLRAVLARYLMTSPGEIRFAYGAHGKPLLDPAFHGESLSFSVSHRRDIALAAIARAMDVGVDVESVEPVKDLDSLAARFLTEREREVFYAVAESERVSTFLTAWTRKEAFLKAVGEGLSRRPDLIEVRLDCVPATELAGFAEGETDPPDKGEGVRRELWKVETVVPAPRYVGAVAGQGTGWRIRWSDWR